MALIDCINDVCDLSTQAVEQINETRVHIVQLLQQIGKDAEVFECVLKGPVGAYCTGRHGTYLTLKEALNRVNAVSIAGIGTELFTATAGQTAFTLTVGAPPTAEALEVTLNGAFCRNPADYTLTGTTLTFNEPLEAGDEVQARVFAA